MQISCHNCQYIIQVHPQGGHYTCPRCGAHNVANSQFPQQQYAQAAPKKGNVGLWLSFAAFFALGLIALLTQWVGVGLGVLLIAWGIAAAVGKIKGIGQLFFPKSTNRIGLTILSISLGGFVSMCGGMGAGAQISKDKKEAERVEEIQAQKAADAAEEQRQAEADAAAKAAYETQLQENADKAAGEVKATLDAVEALVAEEKWAEADEKMKAASGPIDEYRKLDPIPQAMLAEIGRRDALEPQLAKKRMERKVAIWVEAAQAAVSDKSLCEDETTMNNLAKAAPSPKSIADDDPNRAKFDELASKVNACITNMPPPSKWSYRTRQDPMGGTVTTASIQSNNTFEFDFPYQGAQHATLTVRKDGGKDVILGIEQGQFMCTMGCSVYVRFDNGKTQRWRAVGPSDHDSTVIFLRKTSSFLKQLRNAKTLRIEAEFFQEGRHVLEFSVSRFEHKRFK